MPAHQSVGAAEERTPVGMTRGTHALELWISRVLLGGVLLAASIIFLGLARLLTAPPQGGEPATTAALIQQETHPTSLGAILHGVGEGRPTSLVRLGVLVLILTPVARVAMTVVLFLAQRDWVFVALAAFVLVLLVLGLVGALA